jgi:hypothetical protein
MRRRYTPAVKDAAAQVQSAVDSGMDYLRDAWPEIREWLSAASDKSIYARKNSAKQSYGRGSGSDAAWPCLRDGTPASLR